MVSTRVLNICTEIANKKMLVRIYLGCGAWNDDRLAKNFQHTYKSQMIYNMNSFVLLVSL